MITHQESLQQFHTQIRYVLEHYQSHGLKISAYKHVVVAGMGGSGIGGKLVKCWFADKLAIPMEVVSDYRLPAYAGKETLLILCSYSGNTEETLSVMEQGIAAGCKMLAVAAGGQLAAKAAELNMPFYQIEDGFQPRMALGESFGFLLKIFAELLGENVDEDLNAAAETLVDQSSHLETAESILGLFKSQLKHKYVVYADARLEAVALRFCQQLNENSKCEAFVEPLPEANHNVIESLYGKQDTNFILLDSQYNERVSLRFEFLKGLLERENNKIAHIVVESMTLKNIIALIHRLDWYSILVTEPLHVNPMLIENIVSLKDFLSGAINEEDEE